MENITVYWSFTCNSNLVLRRIIYLQLVRQLGCSALFRVNWFICHYVKYKNPVKVVKTRQVFFSQVLCATAWLPSLEFRRTVCNSFSGLESTKFRSLCGFIAAFLSWLFYIWNALPLVLIFLEKENDTLYIFYFFLTLVRSSSEDFWKHSLC